MIKEGDVVLCCGKYRLVHAVRSMGIYFKDFQGGEDLESAPALVNIKEVKELTHDDFLTIFNRVAGHDLIVGVGISETAFSRMLYLIAPNPIQ